MGVPIRLGAGFSATTIKDKLIVGELALRGVPSGTIAFFMNCLSELRRNPLSGITLKTAAELAAMTEQGCRRHLKRLAQEGYLSRPSSRSFWVLNADSLIKDKDLSYLAGLIYEPTLPKRKANYRAAS
jgi:hypothetical protein